MRCWVGSGILGRKMREGIKMEGEKWLVKNGLREKEDC